jgi:transketolase
MAQSADLASVNTLRVLAADAVEKARSGHPGMPMGAAPMAYVLWTRFLKFDPSNPLWPDRDRFVLSAGHGSMLLYGLLHLSGYPLDLEELKRFRQWESRTPGHPESLATLGVETTTGPLGQGFAAAVGMAIAERHLAARFNRPDHALVDHRTYAIAGDGDLMEGVTAEAASLAGHLGLGRLVVLYDDNHITIEGGTDLSFSEDVAKRFGGYGWRVIGVDDGNDLSRIGAALEEARAGETQPTLVCVRTHIGFGSPKKQDTADAHGAPLGPEEVRRAKENLGWPTAPDFHVPEVARIPFREAAERGRRAREAWEERFAWYRRAHPELADEWERRTEGRLPEGWEEALPQFPEDPKGLATRVAGGKVLNAVASTLPELAGGSADLAPSTKTYLGADTDFSRENPGGRNLRFGVREHGMAAVLNGIANHGGLRPYGSTFLAFADYMRPSLRLAALMRAPVIHVFTHDSIFVGEDGPTHQPIEHLPSLRAIPNLAVIRPADANETAEAWKIALERKSGPTALLLTRQSVPTLGRSALGAASGLRRGGYVLREAKGGSDALRVILIASGSEVHLALPASEELEARGFPARVVSLPSWELFEAQDSAYRESVLPSTVAARVAVEAASPFGWERYIGNTGRAIGMDRFGVSAPAEVLAEKFGFTPGHVVEVALEVLRGVEPDR